jgi:hypothetical protein
MRKRKTTFTPNVDGLERREVLSTAHAPIAQLALVGAQATNVPGTGDGIIVTSIPYVIAPTGTHQFSINFTSNTFHQIINGMNSAAQEFLRTGNQNRVLARLTNLSHRVPYGNQLLTIWENDLAFYGLGANPLGASRAAAAGVNGSTVSTALNQLKLDLNNFLQAGEGSAFNVLKSRVRWPTDAVLIFNGRVGHGPARFQPVVTGIPGLLT